MGKIIPVLFALFLILINANAFAERDGLKKLNSNELTHIYTSGGDGFIDSTGKVIISPRFQQISDFSEGLAAVRFEEKWGYIDRTGEFIIKNNFESAYPFADGLARVQINGKLGFINKGGNLVIKPIFNLISNFSDGLAAAYVDGKTGYINKTGNIVIKPQFQSGHDFSEGLAAVEINNKWGYIDKVGSIVIKPQFEQAVGFSEGLAAVQLLDKWGYIDKSGKMVIRPRFDETYRFSDGLALVSINGERGYIDKTGELVISTQFRNADDFSEGLAPVARDSKWNYIDKTGKVVIDLQFLPNEWSIARSFSNDLAFVGNIKKYSYIDKTGKIIFSYDAYGKAIDGTFMREPFGYGYNYLLIPKGKDSSEFPYLKGTHPSKYFDFVRMTEEEVRNISVRDIGEFSYVMGFSDLLGKLDMANIYELQAKKEELIDRLVAAHKSYVDEYNKYLQSLFLIDENSPIQIKEEKYNLDNQQIEFYVEFANKVVPRAPKLSNYSDPQKEILYSFFEDFNGKINTYFDIEIAEQFFIKYEGKIGERIGEGMIKYWIKPTGRYHSGANLSITEMKLIKLELTLIGKKEHTIKVMEADFPW